MKIRFSGHTWERMHMRGITEETIRDILCNPDYTKNSFGGRKIAAKKPERWWPVAFIEDGDTVTVISVFPEREKD